jgi:hypothetical protein
MNERIKELAERANANFSDGLEFSVVFGEMEDFEKFVGLIVLECASIANQRFSLSTGLDDRDCWTAIEIKEHFGVEE